MKKWIVLFALIFSLAGCTQSEGGIVEIIQKQPLIKPLEYVESGNFSQLNKFLEGEIEQFVASMDETDLLSAIRLQQLKEKDVSIKVENSKRGLLLILL